MTSGNFCISSVDMLGNTILVNILQNTSNSLEEPGHDSTGPALWSVFTGRIIFKILRYLVKVQQHSCLDPVRSLFRPNKDLLLEEIAINFIFSRFLRRNIKLLQCPLPCDPWILIASGMVWIFYNRKASADDLLSKN